MTKMDSPLNDVWTSKGSLKNNLLEYVTPYKLCVVLFIQQMCHFKSNSRRSFHYRQSVFQEDQKPIHRRDFCMLALHLIQSPDMTYEELIQLLESGKYTLLREIIENFKIEVKDLLSRDAGSIMDTLNNVERFSIEPNSYEPLIKGSSKLGLFLRRVKLFFDKLCFSQTVGMHRALKVYLEPERMNSPSMDWKLNAFDDAPDFKGSGTCTGPLGLWSKRQVELFLGQQAKLIQEGGALPAPELQARLRDVLLGNPEHAEAHFVSYANCLKSREFCGAVDSLFHYFDRRSLPCDEESKSKGLSYAALNLAILHSTFNHRQEAMYALKEAITLAHESNDNICLQHAQAWMYKLTNDEKGVIIDRSKAKCEDLNLNYLYSFGLQAFAEHSAKTAGLPANVFEMLSKSDVVNCQHSLLDLLSTGHAMRAALWAMYGRTELAALSSQLLLHSQTSSSSGTEPIVIAISNVALYFTIQGDYSLAWAVVNHGKDRAPDSKWWVWSESVLCFTESLNRGLWGLAKEAIDRLAAVDPIEAFLRESELHLARGDREGAERAGRKALEKANDSPVLKVRALYWIAKASPKSAVLSLTDAYHIASQYYIDYWAALIGHEMANIQLEMGLSHQAVKTVEGALLRVLSHGSWCDISDGLVLYAKCRVATLKSKHTDISEAIRLLSKAATLARQIEAYSKVKKIVYLQAFLAHSIGMFAERNKFAYEFRLLDEEYQTDDSPLSASH